MIVAMLYLSDAALYFRAADAAAPRYYL